MSAKGINKGPKNGNWSGGFYITNRGYKKILLRSHPRSDDQGYVLEHIVIMEKKIGRKLRKGERVHHIDHDKLNNDPENLMLFKSHSDHLKYEADQRGRRRKFVKCDFCGKEFWKRLSWVGRFNFCCQAHVRPHLWGSRWGKKPSLVSNFSA